MSDQFTNTPSHISSAAQAGSGAADVFASAGLQTDFVFGLPPTADAAFRMRGLFSTEASDGQAAHNEAALRFAPAWHDMDMLDHLAHTAELSVTLLSLPAYAHVQDRYRLLPCGARFGAGYGAMVVTYNPLERVDLKNVQIGVPGLRNSGFLALSLFFAPDTFRYTLIADDQLREATARGDVDAALLTGEEQLTHQALGLYNIVDLGAWWEEQTQLLLPLEVVAVRRDVPPDAQARIARQVYASVQDSLTHRHSALDYAHSYARKMDRESVDVYVGMYVTPQSMQMDELGRRSIQAFLERGAQAGLIPLVPELDIAPLA